MKRIDIINKTRGFAKEIFGTEFNLPIRFSGKMTKSLGYFRYSPSAKRPICIQYAERLLYEYNESSIDSVILHELTHWYLFINNKPHSDGDGYFKREVLRVGASLTGAIPRAGSGYEITCSCCHKSIGFITSQKVNKMNKYVSKCCRSSIKVGEFKNKEDEYVRPKAAEQWIEDVIAKYNVNKVKVKISDPKDVKQVAEVPAKEDVTNKKINLTYNEVIKLKRVTNAQMIPALKYAIDTNNFTDILLLQKKYPEVYDSTLKYLGKGYTAKLNKLVG